MEKMNQAGHNTQHELNRSADPSISLPVVLQSISRLNSSCFPSPKTTSSRSDLLPIMESDSGSTKTRRPGVAPGEKCLIRQASSIAVHRWSKAALAGGILRGTRPAFSAWCTHPIMPPASQSNDNCRSRPQYPLCNHSSLRLRTPDALARRK